MSEVEVVGDGAGSGSSGVVPSDGGGSAVGGDGAAATPTPAADGRVVPQLDSVDATTTLRSGNGTPVSHHSPTDFWQECQEVVGLAGVSPVYACHPREKRVLPSLQAFAQVETGERYSRHVRALQEKSPTTLR